MDGDWVIRTGAGAVAGAGTDATRIVTDGIVAFGELPPEFRWQRQELSTPQYVYPVELQCATDASWAGSARVPPAERHPELRHIAVAADKC